MTVEVGSESQNKPHGQSKKRPLNGTRVLVVGNDPAMSLAINEALSANDIRSVALVESADVGLRFQEEKFDLILVDASAPARDAVNLVKKMRSPGLNQNTPIIMISDDQRPGAMSEGFGAGASFFVYKPLDKAHLMRLIQVTQGTVQHEKRRFRRVMVRTPVRVQHGDKTLEGETIDVSLNGVFVKAAGAFPPGSRIKVNLYLHSGAVPVFGLGYVRRVTTGNQMGIQFDRLSVAESERLQEYLLPLIED